MLLYSNAGSLLLCKNKRYLIIWALFPFRVGIRINGCDINLINFIMHRFSNGIWRGAKWVPVIYGTGGSVVLCVAAVLLLLLLFLCSVVV